MNKFIDIVATGLLAIGLAAAILVPIGLCLFVALAILSRWYSRAYGADRKRERGHELPTRIRWINWLYALLCSYYWAACPRCGRMYGGHETGGIEGGHCTCDNCPEARGWFPYGQDTSRFHDGKDWVGPPVRAAYFDLNKKEEGG
jgi:hypothetical protein